MLGLQKLVNVFLDGEWQEPTENKKRNPLPEKVLYSECVALAQDARMFFLSDESVKALQKDKGDFDLVKNKVDWKDIPWPFPVCSFEATSSLFDAMGDTIDVTAHLVEKMPPGSKARALVDETYRELKGLPGPIANAPDGMVGCIVFDSIHESIWTLRYQLGGLKHDVYRNSWSDLSSDTKDARVVNGTNERDNMLEIIDTLISLLSKEKTWKNQVKNTITAPRLNRKKQAKTKSSKIKIPKSCIYIVGKNPKGTVVNGSLSKNPVQVEWSHQWMVRGHYRDIDGIGKSPRGVYDQRGRTWVREHVKGPEDKQLIEKHRIVKV